MEIRDKTLDIAKGISIILMVISHVGFTTTHHLINKINQNFLIQFKMSLFMVISGYLYSNKKSLAEYFYKKSDGLLKPILFIFLITGIVAIYNTPTDRSSFTIINTYITSNYTPTWFIFSLFITLMIFRIIDLIFHKYGVFYTLIAILITIVTLSFFHTTKFNISLIKLYNIIYFVLFIGIGRLINHYKILDYTNQFKIFIMCFIFFVLVCMYKKPLNVIIKFYQNIYGEFFLTTIVSIAGVFSILYLSKIICKFKLISKILVESSKASLFIIVFHTMIGHYLLFPIFRNIFGKNVFTDGIGFILTILLCYLIYFIVKKSRYLKYLLLPVSFTQFKSFFFNR